MNILIWNCRGSLNPNFRSIMNGMVNSYSPTIMIISETKTSGKRAKGIADRLPLGVAIFANTIGLAGGLWLLWDSTQVDIVEVSSTEQEIHVVVILSYSNNPWLLFAIYASPRYVERHLLWENLEAISGLHSLPWVITGDFNGVLMGEDKFGGRPININKALQCQECLDACRMIEIGYSGPRYTWSNNRPLTGLIQERIDRVFVNADRNGHYLEAYVRHLERSHSDHCLVLLSMARNQGITLPHPFRFQPMWLSHSSFLAVVRDAWMSPTILSHAISNFETKAKEWNKNVFGNLFY